MKAEVKTVYSPEELALIDEARPKPVFENVHLDERDLFLTHPENSWRCSFEMFDEGLPLIDPLEIKSFERVDIVNGKTGRILRKDCGCGEFIYESPVSGRGGRLGSYILGPVLDLTLEEYAGLLKKHPSCVIRNVVFSNDVVDMAVDRFICSMDPSDEHKTIILKDVSYRFSEKIKDLPFEKKAGLVRRRPEIELESVDVKTASVTRERFPSVSSVYCSDVAKEAFESGETVEAAVIRIGFVDKNHELSSGSVSFEATLEGLNRKKPGSKFAVLSTVSGIADENGRFSFETVLLLGASKDEAEKTWGRPYVDEFNLYLNLQVRNGFAVESYNDSITGFGPLSPDIGYSPDVPGI